MISIIIPVHTRHFDKIQPIVNSLKNNEKIKLHFVFTNQNEYKQYKANHEPSDENFIPLFLNELVGEKAYNIILAKNLKDVYVTSKKLFALKEMIDKFDYAICMDIDIEIINPHLFLDACETLVNKKIINSMYPISGYFHSLNLKAIEFLFENREIPIEIRNKSNSYFWFSEIPIYDMKVVPEFLNFLNTQNEELFVNKLEGDIFDYLLYYYYCMWKHGYDLQVHQINSKMSVEFLNSTEWLMLNEKIKTHWIPQIAMDYNMLEIHKEKICVIFHTDRLSYNT